MAFGFTLKTELVTNGQGIKRPNKIIAYDFKNVGDTIVNIVPEGSDFAWSLYPGEAMNTMVPGGMDLTKYSINFKSENDIDPDSQVSECIVTYIIGV